MAKMTVTDRLILTDIILDKLNESNEGKMTKRKLNKEANQDMQIHFKADLKDLLGIAKRQEELSIKESKIKNAIDNEIKAMTGEDYYCYHSLVEQTIGDGDKRRVDKVIITCSELEKVFRKTLAKKYRLTIVPDKYEIEKEIVKAGNKDYDLLIKDIVKNLIK